jgi:hypothetical protein
MDDHLIRVKRARILLSRLERLSADSSWAHRASGLRGSIIRILNNQDVLSGDEGIITLEILLKQGFDLLTRAAKEIPDCENKS